MGELMVMLMVLIFLVGLGVVVKDILAHDKSHRLTKHSSGRLNSRR